MEGFHYVDIFASKGLEYLLVLGFLAAFTFVWWLLNRPGRKGFSTVPPQRASPALADSRWFEVPDEILYHPGHAWATPESDRVYRVGMDDFAQHLLGVAEAIELPPVGTELKQGGKGWKLNLHGRDIDMLSPVTGRVVDVNQEVLSAPRLVNVSPYEKGWLLKVAVHQEEENRRNLLEGPFAKAWMTETVHSIRGLMPRPAGAVLQDGGLPVSGFAREVWPERWHEVSQGFLRTDGMRASFAKDRRRAGEVRRR